MRADKSRSLMLAILLGATLHLEAMAQSAPPKSTLAPPDGIQQASESSTVAPQSAVPKAAGGSTEDHSGDGRIYGTVTDPHGNVVPGASVTLEGEPSGSRLTALTDTTGEFTFPDLGAGTYRITVTAKGFADWTGSVIALSTGQYYNLPEIVLKVASANTDVKVVFTPYDEAELQIKAQEQQRIIGVFPNFYASYVWNAVAMTPGQKFRLALRTSVDPVTFAVAGATAGIEQWQDYFSGYGQGAEGYGKRFGAAYADDVIDTFIGSAILPSILHQDPRYFYKGTGSVPSRALYAISTVVICRGDNGHWQPNYSNVAGNLISAGISNLYYPAGNRNGAVETIENALISTAEGAATALLQEFLIKKLSRGVPQQPPVPPPGTN